MSALGRKRRVRAYDCRRVLESLLARFRRCRDRGKGKELFVHVNKLLGLAFISALTITARIAPMKAAGKVNVECSKGAICFSGQVSDGAEFHRIINDKLEFRLRANDWTIEVSPRVTKSGCEEFASV